MSSDNSGHYRREVIAAGAGLVSLASLSGCISGFGGAGGGPVQIGQSSMTGGIFEAMEPTFSQVAELTQKEINDAGGPLDRELEIKQRATGAKPQPAREAIEKWKNTDEVAAISGIMSSSAIPIWDFIQQQEIPIISWGAGAPFFDTRGGDEGTPDEVSDDEWFWRTIIGDSVMNIGLVNHALNNDVTRIGIMNNASQGSRAWADAFSRAFESQGGTVATRVEFEAGKSSYGSEVDRLFQADFDGWALTASVEDAVPIVRAWRNGDYRTQLILENSLKHPELIENAGELVDGAWTATPIASGSRSESFVEKFKSAGDATYRPGFTGANYDANNVLALAIHRAGETTVEEVQKNIGPVSRPGGTEVTTFSEGKEELNNGNEINYQGAASSANFTEFGNVLSDVAIWNATSSEFTQVESISESTLAEVAENY